MLSVLSFKDELARYHNIDELEPDMIGSEPDVVAHIARWAKDGRAEDIWATIHADASDLEAATFIDFVVYERLVATRVEPEESESKYFKACLRWSQRVVSASESVAELIAAHEQAAHALRERTENRTFSLQLETAFFGGRRRRLREHQWQDVEYFVRSVAIRLHSWGGRWFDKEVAMLAEIAFPNKDPVTVDQIRTWRKRRTAPSRQTRGA